MVCNSVQYEAFGAGEQESRGARDGKLAAKGALAAQHGRSAVDYSYLCRAFVPLSF